MKRSLKLFSFIFFIFVLTACNKQDNDKDKLELFILRRDEGSNEFVKDKDPIFTGNDIESYDWDTHTIIFTDTYLSRQKFDKDEMEDILIGGSIILGVFYPDQFAFYLDGEELYRGYLKPPAFVSFMPGGPMISDVDNGIEIRSLTSEEDTRNNEKLYEFLQDNELLKEEVVRIGKGA